MAPSFDLSLRHVATDRLQRLTVDGDDVGVADDRSQVVPTLSVGSNEQAAGTAGRWEPQAVSPDRELLGRLGAYVCVDGSQWSWRA
jgi:hypothetical protein